MKKYLHKPDYESNDIQKIEATESIKIDLDNYDVENDPDGIFDIDDLDDDMSYSFESYDEYKKFMRIFDAR